MRAGDRVPFVLTWHHSNEDAPAVADPEVALRKTLAFWSQWSQKGTPVAGPYREAITRSLWPSSEMTAGDSHNTRPRRCPVRGW